MKLYQALTQVTINQVMVDDAPEFNIRTQLNQPLHFTPTELYHYIDSVLKPGSRHDQNNLKFVADAASLRRITISPFLRPKTVFTTSKQKWKRPATW